MSQPFKYKRAEPAPVVRRKVRCAVYTRVSNDERLNQEFTSLDAQEEAGRAYVRSQQHEGWIALSDSYRDDGYSAGSLNRPALQRLVQDIQEGRVDVVVVYKLDRLTRSMRDFYELCDLFDAYDVSYVAITQPINTATAMGRLIQNMMLSFAQFEREQTGERIRDKIAASKARGMWMGGKPPLGYDVKDRKLVVNEEEAALVRDIFRGFAEHGSAVRIVRELATQGKTTKSWVTQSGRYRKGRPIDQPFVYNLLRNRTYLGQVEFGGKVYPGQHEAIITQEVWDAVHAFIDRRKRGTRERADDRPALLRGLLFAPDGQRMIATYTRKGNGKEYRYYVPRHYKRGAVSKQAAQGGIGLLPAADIEAAVLAQIHSVLEQPEMLVAAWKACTLLPGGQCIDEARAMVALRRMGGVWDELMPAEQHRIAQLLIERVQLHSSGLDIVWRDEGWTGLNADVHAHPFVQEQREPGWAA